MPVNRKEGCLTVYLDGVTTRTHNRRLSIVSIEKPEGSGVQIGWWSATGQTKRTAISKPLRKSGTATSIALSDEAVEILYETLKEYLWRKELGEFSTNPTHNGSDA